jgi:hypothetical protein
MRNFILHLCACALLLAACDKRDEIKVYRLAKAPIESQPAQNPGMPAMSGLPAAHPEISGAPRAASAGGPTLSGVVPGEWEPQPPSSIRVASFLAKGKDGAVADISLVVLGSAGGGELENVNRWLNQLGQPAATQEQLARMAQHQATPLGDALIVDLKGLASGADPLKDGRIIAAIVNSSGRTLFYKMRGNADLVAAQKDAFVRWVKTVDAKPGGDMQQASTAELSPAPSAADSQGPRLTWEVPEGWTSAPASSMRYASFAAEKEGEKADISVVMFPGDGGGDLENVNRWRSQIGLEAIAEAELAASVVPLEGKDGKIATVDIKGATSRMLAGWVRHDGSVWFIKMTGSDALITSEKPKFEKFIRSVEFQHRSAP